MSLSIGDINFYKSGLFEQIEFVNFYKHDNLISIILFNENKKKNFHSNFTYDEKYSFKQRYCDFYSYYLFLIEQKIPIECKYFSDNICVVSFNSSSKLLIEHDFSNPNNFIDKITTFNEKYNIMNICTQSLKLFSFDYDIFPLFFSSVNDLKFNKFNLYMSENFLPGYFSLYEVSCFEKKIFKKNFENFCTSEKKFNYYADSLLFLDPHIGPDSKVKIRYIFYSNIISSKLVAPEEISSKLKKNHKEIIIPYLTSGNRCFRLF